MCPSWKTTWDSVSPLSLCLCEDLRTDVINVLDTRKGVFSDSLAVFSVPCLMSGACMCCFTCLTGKYRTQLWDKHTGSFLPSTPGLGMHVEIKDPDAKVSLML